MALFFHLFGALLFVAGIMVAGVLFEAARRRSDPAEIALLLGITRVGVALVVVGATLTLAFGLWLVHLQDVGYGAGWIDAALALFGVALVLGAVGGQRPKRARLLASRLAASGAPTTSELRDCSTTACRSQPTTSPLRPSSPVKRAGNSHPWLKICGFNFQRISGVWTS